MAFLHPPPPPPNPYRMGLDHPTTTTSMDHMRNVGHACHTVRLQGVSKLIEKRNITSHLERSDKPHGPSCKHIGAILGSLGAILTVLEAVLSVSEASWAVFFFLLSKLTPVGRREPPIWSENARVATLQNDITATFMLAARSE